MIFHYCSVILLGVVALGQCHAATWALLVGISTYGNELALQEHEQLRFPETDAEGLHAILLSKEGGNIPPGNVRLLLGKDATRQNLAVALGKWLPAVAGPDDTVIIYFSGHGHYERGAGYLVTWDARRAAIASTSYPMADLRRALAALRARSKIVFTDACHAGALNQSVDATGKLRENLLDLDRSVFSLAASAASQQALELSNPEDRHTLFSQFLISGMAGHADLNCDGSITAAELGAYVREEVIGESNGAQEPTWSPKQGLDRLLLARYSKPRCVSAATKRGSLLVDTPGLACNDTRNSAVLLFDGIVAGTLCGAGKLRIPGVASGPHSVRIERTGFLPFSTTVQVPPGAQASVRAALQPRPGMPASLVDELAKAERGYWKGGDQDLKKALATLDRIAARQPDSAEIAHRQGLVLQVAGNPAAARASFEKALSLDASFLPARVLLAEHLTNSAGEGPGQAVRLLGEVREMLRNDVLAGVVLSRAYQRAGVCSESVRWAQRAAANTAGKGELQAEPLVEHGASLLQCAQDADFTDARTQLLKRAAQAFEDALARLRRFRSDNGGKIWYEVGGLVGIGWKYEAAKKEQYERLMVDSHAGLCEARFRTGEFCLALPACEAWRKLRPNDAEALYWSAGATAGSAYGNRTCPGSAATFQTACDIYRQLDVSQLGSIQLRSQAEALGRALATKGCAVR